MVEIINSIVSQDVSLDKKIVNECSHTKKVYQSSEKRTEFDYPHMHLACESLLDSLRWAYTLNAHHRGNVKSICKTYTLSNWKTTPPHPRDAIERKSANWSGAAPIRRVF